jgi:thiol:disulfide interchange protein DsbC
MILFLITLIAFSSTSFAMAKEGCGGDCMICHKLTTKEAGDLLKDIGVTVKSVKPAPANGLFEILLEKDGKPGLLFIDYGKKHLIQGMMVKLPELKPVAAHQKDLPQQKQITSVATNTIPVKNAVILGNPKGSKKLYVFTDPDCPYCRTFHTELKKLAKTAPDVAIHVMLFPLPMHPAAYDKSRTVIETGSLQNLDKAFEGKEVPKPAKESSKAAIDEIIKYANANGITGTPTMVMPDGKIMVGGRDAEELKKLLSSEK